MSNVYSGVVSGVDGGAGGVVVAHWSSSAALTPLVFAWPPILVSAGLAWNHNTHWVSHLMPLVFVFILLSFLLTEALSGLPYR